MTNWEKFKEVFKLPDNIEPISTYPCDMFECDKIKCSDCPYYEEDIGYWDKEYKESEENDNEDSKN